MRFECDVIWNRTLSSSLIPGSGDAFSDCGLYLTQLLSNSLFTYLIVLIFLYRKCCIRKPLLLPRPSDRRRDYDFDQRKYRLFRHHTVTWLLTFTLTISFLVELGESLIVLLNGFYSKVSLTPQEFLPALTPASSLLAIIFAGLFYHRIEARQEPRFLWINSFLYISTGIFSSLKLYVHLTPLGLTYEHVKVLAGFTTVMASFTLFFTLLHAFHSHRGPRRWIRKDTPKARSPDLSEGDGSEGLPILESVRYSHYYSSLISRLTFYWFTRLLWIGYKHPLEDEDLGTLPPEEKSLYQFNKFNEIYLNEQGKARRKGENVSLWSCLFKTHCASLVLSGIFRLAADCFGFVAPLGIKTIVEYVGRNSSQITYHQVNVNDDIGSVESNLVEHLTILEFMQNGYIMAIIILLAGIIQSTFSQCSTFLVNSEGIHVKIALQALIYKKSLNLSPTKRSGGGENEDDDDEEEDDEKSTESAGASSGPSTGFDTGSIANVMSEDTNNIMMFFWMAHFIWAIPLKLAVLMILLYLQLGFSALIGAAICIVLMIPLQFLIGKKMSSNSKELMERCDERLRSTTEILQGMKLLKLHGWEIIFSQQVSSVRQKELVNLDRDLLYRSIMTFLTHISSVLVTVVTFGLYSYIESERLEPAKVFAGLALFNQLTVPLFIFPITVPVVIDALVSARRLKEFLELREVGSVPGGPEPEDDENFEDGGQNDTINSNSANNVSNLLVPGKDLQMSTDSVFILDKIEEDDENDEDCDDNESPPLVSETGGDEGDHNQKTGEKLKEIQKEDFVISVQGGSYSWDEDRDEGQLSDISLVVPRGQMTVIVGSIGSGKSSMISALLGEMRVVRMESAVWSKGISIAYAAQKPWMLNASVRENIIFGRQFKPRRYERVIQACALQPDIDILPERDDTEIGEKGINLSGGQKQRIAIARCLYSSAKVVILDDPLSALDSLVAHQLIQSGIRNFLLKSKRTVILVTHHLPVLHFAHHVVAMEKGRIRIQGTLSEIQERDSSLYQEWKEIMTKKELEVQKQLESKTAKERWSLLKLVSKIGLQFRSKGNNENWKGDDNVNMKSQLEPFRKRKGTFSHYKNLSHDIFLPSDECHDELITPILRRRVANRERSRESRTSASSSASQRHPELARVSSLQVEKHARSPLLQKKDRLQRLQSLPAAPDEGILKPPTSPTPRTRSGTLDNNQKVQELNLIRKLFNKKAASSTDSMRLSSTELEKMPSVSLTPSTTTDMPNLPASLSGPTPQRLISTVSYISDAAEMGDEEEEGAEDALLTKDMNREEREYGTIPMKVYWSYIQSSGYLLSGFYLVFAIGYELIRVLTNFWLSRWSNEVSQMEGDEEYEAGMRFYFGVYVGLSLVTVAVSLACNLVGKQAGANSREVLHRKMLDCVVRCPMRFFDSTPIGRLINRFQSDITVVDRKLCISMQRFLQFVFLCVSAIIVNAIVNPWFLVVAIPVVAIYYFIQRFYRFSSRELQRIEAISRGPIYSHFHETLMGLSTIRAFRQQKRFTRKMLGKIDNNNKAALFINVGNRWLSISLDYLGSFIVFLATIASMVSSELYPDVVTPSMVGLAINYTLLVPVYLNWVVKFMAEVEMFMNSVERIGRYSELESEDYDSNNGGGSKLNLPEKLPEEWPIRGEVVFENVSIHYGPDRPAIIHQLNSHIHARQKVGICGRSGSGKSTLLMALFRITDVGSGLITIDGVDIKSIPLLKLRSSLAIIPQENILFTGTLRFNLDPEKKIPDDEIWKALELCQMKEFVKELPGQIDTEIKDGGVKFSAGQKQLLGLARAILRKSKLVIMDEATSSVDVGTERTLLQVVRDVCKEATVLSIAHRLDTILDGDRVIVLDQGKLAEDGPPRTLIRRQNSLFSKMVKEDNEQDQLT